MRRIVDLTLPIGNHWRYGISFSPACSFEKGDSWQTTAYNLESHWFTHIDAPRHFDPQGKTLQEYPISRYGVTNCLILDVSYIGDDEGITAKMLEAANAPFADQHFDSLCIRSDRGKKVSWKSPDYWDHSCYLTEDAGIWIRDYKPVLVAYDFAQDYEIRLIKNRRLSISPSTTMYLWRAGSCRWSI